MLYSSLTFLFGFLPILLILYFISKNRNIKNAILLIFSLIFYAWGEPKYILLMLITVLVVYLFGLLIDKYDKNKQFKKKKIVFVSCLLVVVANLLFFKYFNFILDNINYLFSFNIKSLNIVLPIGISFYTFQILSYAIDLYNNKIKVQNNLFSLALYVAFFPQLIAGPIVRYETVEEEINDRKESFDDMLYGAKRFILGLSKKVIIANQMALIADLVYNNYNEFFGTSIIWLGTITYALQIYYDFSGYSDMAIGLGRIFGFHFLENFDYPYVSKSITEFWRRWHISLSTWFRDYIYIPLGGNRVSKIKWLRNVFIVWSLTGLWHGASWNFILWGLFYAVFLIIEKLILNKFLNKLSSFIRWCYVIIIVLVGWVLFRANSFNDILFFLKNMFIYSETDWLNILSNNFYNFSGLIFIIPAVVFSLPIYKKIDLKFKDNLWYTVVSNIVLLMLLFVCVVFLTSSSYNPFIYFRF